MALAYEGNTDLAFDTDVLKNAGKEYKEVATELRDMAAELDRLLADLKDNGWTTPAGDAFYELTNTNWEKNINKYASLLDTLNVILCKAADEYQDLLTHHVQNTKVNI